MVKLILMLLMGVLVGIGLSMNTPAPSILFGAEIRYQDSVDVKDSVVAKAVLYDAKEVGLICSSNQATNGQNTVKINS